MSQQALANIKVRTRADAIIRPPRTSDSPGKRWSTSTSSALDEVASKLEYDRASRIKSLNDRKMANTITSINFGNDEVKYVSSSIESQANGAAPVSTADRASQVAAIKKMKGDLTVTNFTLGDENPVYDTTNRSAMAASAAAWSGGLSRNSLSQEVKDLVKKSSLFFGNESVAYRSSAHDAMQYRGTSQAYSALKDEVQKMSNTLRQHNFSMGEEKVDYTSDYSRGFGSAPSREVYSSKGSSRAQLKSVIEDSRNCHFTFGAEKVDYLTNTQAGLRDVLSRKDEEKKKSTENAKKLKESLTKTSIIIGDDADYL